MFTSEYVPLIVTFLFNLFFGVLVFVRNPKNSINIYFALLTLAILGWISTLFLFYSPRQVSDYSLLIGKTSFAVGIFIPFFLSSFIYYFPKKTLMIHKTQSYLWSIVPIIGFVISLFTPYVVNSVTEENSNSIVHFGNLYPLYITLFILEFVAVLYLLINKLNSFKGLYKAQLYYLLIGSTIGITIGLVTNIFLPILGYQSYAQYGYVATIIFLGFIAYSILKHRLLDISLAIRNILISLLSSTLITFTAITTVSIFGELTLSELDSKLIASVYAAVFIGTYLLPKFAKVSALLLDKVYFGRSIDYKDSQFTLSKELLKTLNINELTSLISSNLIKTLGLDKAAIIIKDELKNCFVVSENTGFSTLHGIALASDDTLVNYFFTNKKILVVDEFDKLISEISSEVENSKLQNVLDRLNKMEASLIIPIYSKEDLISLIILGNKKGGDAYTVEDLNLLELISSQAAIALENARLYAQVTDLNENLQDKVEKAAGEIRRKNEDLEKANVELEKANEELKSVDKMKDNLIGVASHELRTPASNAQNYLWLTLTKPECETHFADKDKERLQKSLISIKHLIKLIGDILDVSKIEGGKLEVNLHPVEYEKILKESIDELSQKAQSKGLTINYQLQDNVKRFVLADPLKLKEIFINLISNAIKYTEVGGLSINAKGENNQIVFSFKDTGRGIANENISKLFTKFYREDTSLSSSNPETGGTGLGLFITKSIVELMNGKIWVESKKGEGSTFYVSLPSAEQESIQPHVQDENPLKGFIRKDDYLKMKATSSQTTDDVVLPTFVVPDSTQPSLNTPTDSQINVKKRILLIEDEIEMRQFYSELLSEHFQVDTAVDGLEGLAKLKLNSYDLILLDVMMPKMNGVAFLEELKKDNQIDKTPIILLTNLGEEETLKKCFELGVKAMIMKSDLLPDQVLQVVDKELTPSATI